MAHRSSYYPVSLDAAKPRAHLYTEIMIELHKLIAKRWDRREGGMGTRRPGS